MAFVRPAFWSRVSARWARAGRLAAGVAWLFGCSDDAGAEGTGGRPPPPPATASSSSSSAAAEATEATEPLEPSEACCVQDDAGRSCSACGDGSLTCAARRELGEEPEAEDFRCQEDCVPTDAAGLWCAGNESCCDEAAVCLPSGYCRYPTDPTGGASSGTTAARASDSSGAEGSGG